MPIITEKKEFIIPARDWDRMSNSEMCKFLEAKGFDCQKVKVIRQQNFENFYGCLLIKIVQEDFTEEDKPIYIFEEQTNNSIIKEYSNYIEAKETDPIVKGFKEHDNEIKSKLIGLQFYPKDYNTKH